MNLSASAPAHQRDEAMIVVTFPDRTTRSFPRGVTGAQIAESIAKSLAKAALVVEVDGQLRDLDWPILGDAQVKLVRTQDPAALAVIRHDCAHVMAEAVQDVFPGTQVTIGPAIENGFYYDFFRNEPFSTDDLARIEARMAEIVKADLPFVREEVSRDAARARFDAMGERFKLELLDAIPEGEPVTLYHQGNWFDLCRGPHGPSTGRIGAFKLTKVAGSYWRGDAKNAQLQRIYGTAFATKAELDAYLHQLEEAERRDHRKLGREMDLFHVQEEAAGSVFWHPHGWTLWRAVENYVRRRVDAAGYQEVKTPQLYDRVFWERSGHWEKFRENMFTLEAEERHLALKPMNCPGHVQIYNQQLHSYRDLPLRLAEFGSCHRNEPSGALHGIMRVRAFTQDDAHIFCTPEQITAESVAFCELLMKVYQDFGFTDVRVKFSDRPPVRAGADEVWDQAEAALWEAVRAANLECTLNPGEGAFYGPKLEFILDDRHGRSWQCGTVQLDFVLPERLDLAFVGRDDAAGRPVMIHHAVLGSLERFMGVLLEHHGLDLPAWLAPLQVAVLPVGDGQQAAAVALAERLVAAGLRAEVDGASATLGRRILAAREQGVPVAAILGAAELADGQVALRWRDGRQERLPQDETLRRLAEVAQPPGQAASLPSISA